MSGHSDRPGLDRDHVLAYAQELGFHRAGIAKPEDLDDRAQIALQRWLDLGYQADMAWMADPRRADVQQVLPEVRSIISVALNYYTDHAHSDDPAIGKISRYGWGRDYHRVLHKKLKALAHWLQEQGAIARYYADTGPLSDKSWAQQAGIGWIAKNGNLISREFGSWVFLGEILTDLDLEADQPHTAHCGTCTRCLDACPTGAIVSPAVVDANRCIAYHTIENRAATLPEAIATKLDGWVAGCDICQDVCPWNQRFAQATDVAEFQPYPDNIAPKLRDLAALDETEWNRRFPASALRRIKPSMWRRNARAAIAARGGDLED
ncbi:MAG: tRNA epoxyqueuosine(34) reductase QueG [Oscillatoriales cyanobacterium]|nr:MAG: tRNA epoxyqueuosine(34) reductase QueG [Oscillatoriales cyanobacterium]